MKQREFIVLAIVIGTLALIYAVQTVTAQASTQHSIESTAVATNQLTNHPELDLNGPENPGTDFETTYVEDEAPIAAVHADLTLTDANSSHMEYAAIILQNRPNGSDETLSADTADTNIISYYDENNGTLYLSASDTITNYQTVLRRIKYHNNSDAPDLVDRILTFEVSDGTNSNDPVQSTIAINAINDAPLLDNSGDMQLAAIQEDATAQLGNSVAAIIASAESNGEDRITDPDETETEGFAVIEVGASNGSWQYSIDAGTSWLNFGPVTNNSAVLLNTNARIRFVPQQNFSGQTSFTFRAWDRSSGMNGDTNVDVSINGEATAFSTATETATLDVLAQNDPPKLDANGNLSGLDFVTSFISDGGDVRIVASDATLVDVDNNELISATVTLTNPEDGVLEGLTAVPISTSVTINPYDPSNGQLQIEGSAPIAEYLTIIKSLVYTNTTSELTPDNRIIEFRIGDGAAVSELVTTTITMQAFNNAPVLNPDANLHLTPIPEDSTNPPGDTLAAIIANAAEPPIQDADENPQLGFAVIAASSENGSWQYNLNGGEEWIDFGQVSDTAAVLLIDSARLRFLPLADFDGVDESLTIRAWDRTTGANGSSGVDVSTNGGNSAFSEETAVIKIDITPINDAPLLTLQAGLTAVFVEGSGPVAIAGPSLTLTDIDNDTLSSATVQIQNHLVNEPDMLTYTNEPGITANYNEETGVLNLTGNATAAAYQSILRTIMYTNHSDDPDPTDRIITFSANDGEDMSNVVTSTVMVDPINDLPQIDLNGGANPGTDLYTYYAAGSGATILASLLDLQDVDNTTLIGAVVQIDNRLDGSNEKLTISTENTNITVANNNSGKITLSGQDSITNYELVLRSITYRNTLPEPNRTKRIISYRVSDSEGESETAVVKLTITPQYTYLPFIAHNLHISDEPNDECEQAYPLQINQIQPFFANDRNDWYAFDLTQSQSVRIELTEFTPVEGQLVVASGVCGQGTLQLEGHNADFSPTKIINLGEMAAGHYFIWVITENPTTSGIPYKLKIIAN